ncbi:MAG: aldo/keto reductase [Bacteroidota bacterium]
MRYAPLGRSGLITSNLTLGTMIFGESSSRSTSRADALKMIGTYLDAGGNHLDTADVYAEGRSEEIVGEAISGKRSEVIVATKVRFPTGNGVNEVGLSRHHIIDGVNRSLQRMKTDYIDLLYIHCYDPITPMEETVRALDDLVTSGKVRYLGLSNFKAWQLMKLQALCDKMNAYPFVAAQYQYSLVKRDMEYEFFDLLESEGLGLMPWGPLGGGFLTGKYNRQGPSEGRISTTEAHTEEAWNRRNTEQNWQIIDLVRELANKYEASPSQISLAWILAKAVVPSVILGVRTMEQLEDNLKAKDIILDREDVKALDEVSALPELYPYRMIEAYGGRQL